MSTAAAVRETIAGTFSGWRLWLIQFLVNPALFGLLMVWLLIPVGTIWQVILNGLLAVFLLVAAVILHAGTMNYFYDRYRSEKVSLKSEFARALHNLLPFLICAAVYYFLWRVINQLDSYRETLPIYIRSTLSASMRQHISLSFLMAIYSGFVFMLRWILLPGLMLPFALSAANHGLRGFGRKGIAAWKSAVLSLSYWLILILAALVGVFAVGEIALWTTDFNTSTYRSELFGFIVRLFFSYLLALCGWMLACSVLGRQCGGIDEARADVAGNPRA
jgi:hypothetical protein